MEMGFIEKADDQPLDEEEIRKHLALSAAKLHQWLEGINEPYLLDAIYREAVTMELSTSKLKILQEKMPDREFLPVEDEGQSG